MSGAPTYALGFLDPDGTLRGKNARNAAELFGIGVREPELADRCRVNISPSTGRTTAVEIAWNCGLPADTAALVVRDQTVGTIAAMAVLIIRLRMQSERMRSKTTQELARRIEMIADHDKRLNGPWPGYRWPVTVDHLVTDISPIEAWVTDTTRRLDHRVGVMITWLTTGRFRDEAQVRRRLRGEAEKAISRLRFEACDGVATVVGNHRLATKVGFCLAPVVVAVSNDQRMIARWNKAVWMRWPELLGILESWEPGCWTATDTVLTCTGSVGDRWFSTGGLARAAGKRMS